MFAAALPSMLTSVSSLAGASSGAGGALPEPVSSQTGAQTVGGGAFTVSGGGGESWVPLVAIVLIVLVLSRR